MTVSLGDIPAAPTSISKASWLMMSRRTWSWSCVCQLKPTAPGMWPASYCLVSTSISTSLMLGLPRLALTQSVSTITSGFAYLAIVMSFLSGSPGSEAGDVFDHVRGVLENIVGKNHHAKAFLITHYNFQSAFQNQAGTWPGQQSFILAKFERTAVSEPKIHLQNVIDQRRIKQFGHA